MNSLAAPAASLRGKGGVTFILQALYTATHQKLPDTFAWGKGMTKLDTILRPLGHPKCQATRILSGDTSMFLHAANIKFLDIAHP